jgi:hypothetical protein
MFLCVLVQSFNLRHTEKKKEPVQPSTNINVAVILEKANAIRQVSITLFVSCLLQKSHFFPLPLHERSIAITMTSEEIMNPFENVQKWNAFHLVCLKTEFLPLPNVNRINWKSSEKSFVCSKAPLEFSKGKLWCLQNFECMLKPFCLVFVKVFMASAWSLAQGLGFRV